MGISCSWTVYIAKTRRAFAFYAVQLPDIPITNLYITYKTSIVQLGFDKSGLSPKSKYASGVMLCLC